MDAGILLKHELVLIKHGVCAVLVKHHLGTRLEGASRKQERQHRKQNDGGVAFHCVSSHDCSSGFGTRYRVWIAQTSPGNRQVSRRVMPGMHRYAKRPATSELRRWPIRSWHHGPGSRERMSGA